jgi:hypothetical protein
MYGLILSANGGFTSVNGVNILGGNEENGQLGCGMKGIRTFS